MTGANPEYSHLYDEIDEIKAINADLLAALEKLFDLNCVSYCDYETEKVEAAHKARAAIAKARDF